MRGRCPAVSRQLAAWPGGARTPRPGRRASPRLRAWSSLRRASGAAGLLQLRVDLLVHLTEPAGQILHLAGLPAREEALERVQVRLADRRDRDRRRLRV